MVPLFFFDTISRRHAVETERAGFVARKCGLRIRKRAFLFDELLFSELSDSISRLQTVDKPPHIVAGWAAVQHMKQSTRNLYSRGQSTLYIIRSTCNSGGAWIGTTDNLLKRERPLSAQTTAWENQKLYRVQAYILERKMLFYRPMMCKVESTVVAFPPPKKLSGLRR